jgi:hypothetical protein
MLFLAAGKPSSRNILMVSREPEVGMAAIRTSVTKDKDLTEFLYITATIMELWSHNPA